MNKNNWYKPVYLLMIFFLIVFVFAGPLAASSSNSGRVPVNAAGIAVGVPQTTAVSYERTLNSKMSLKLHAGYLVFLSSGGGRVLWNFRNENVVRPYLFGGITHIFAVAEGYGDPEGGTNYLWAGSGLKFVRKRWVIFAEGCLLLGGDDEKGLGADWHFPFNPAISGGIMLRF